MKVDDLRVGVEQRESGSPIAIAGLADGAGIDQISRVRLQVQRDRFSLADSAVFRTEAVSGRVVDEKPTLQMRVSKKS